MKTLAEEMRSRKQEPEHTDYDTSRNQTLEECAKLVEEQGTSVIVHEETSSYWRKQGVLAATKLLKRGKRQRLALASPIDYSQPTPETSAFMLKIDDSEIDLSQVEAELKTLECERNHYRSLCE